MRESSSGRDRHVDRPGLVPSGNVIPARAMAHSTCGISAARAEWIQSTPAEWCRYMVTCGVGGRDAPRTMQRRKNPGADTAARPKTRIVFPYALIVMPSPERTGDIHVNYWGQCVPGNGPRQRSTRT